MPLSPSRLHRHPLSGHAHRVELMLSLVGRETELVDVDLANGAHKTPEFLALNPFGQVPVLEDDGATLADSNAILVYLARRYDPASTWLPEGATALAAVQRWLSIAAGPLANGPAAARLVKVFGIPLNLDRAQAGARALFDTVEAGLADRDFLTGPVPTIGDVAMYSYTAHAPEGGVSLDPFPAIRNWVARIEALPRFVPMTATPITV